ncbi:MAG: hypothetical protein LBH08_01985 [Puniceicoccales bacterium]|nr:hypothetical protein [Puniceicoccales bacterium]
MKREILKLSFLLNMTLNMAIVSVEGALDFAPTLETELRNKISIYHDPTATREQREEAVRRCIEEGIHPGATFMGNESAVDFTDPMCNDIAKNVVKVYTGNGDDMDVYMGTGTLIDGGLPEKAGKVVVTGYPGKKGDLANLSQCECGIRSIVDEQIILIFPCICLENSSYGRFQVNKNSPYIYVSVDLEGKKVPVKYVCLLEEDNRSQDFCILILENPMVDNDGEVVPGFPLEQLHVMDFETDSHFPRDFCGTEHIKTPQSLSIIGYGSCGIVDEEKFDELRKKVSLDFIEEITGMGKKKVVHPRGVDLTTLGDGWRKSVLKCNCAHNYLDYIKTWVTLMEDDLKSRGKLFDCGAGWLKIAQGWFDMAKEGSSPDRVTEFIESAKNCLEEAKKERQKVEDRLQRMREAIENYKISRYSYTYPQASGGFNGSLVWLMDDNTLKVLGLYGCGLFREEEIKFMGNVILYCPVVM